MSLLDKANDSILKKVAKKRNNSYILRTVNRTCKR